MSKCTRIKDSIIGEFKLSNFGFSGEPEHLVCSQWSCIKPPYYVAYRMLLAILLPVWVITDLVVETNSYFKGNLTFWLIYATNWGFLLLGFTAVLHAFFCIIYLVYRPEGPVFKEGKTPVPLKILWALYNMAANSAIVISFSYYIYLISFEQADFMITPSSYVKHTLNTVYILFDLMISATPIRLFHVVYTFILATCYVIFNVIYYAAGGKDAHDQHSVYYVLNWSTPGKAILAIFVEFVMSLFVQILLWLYYKLRLLVVKNFGQDDSHLAGNNETSGILGDQETSSYNAIQEGINLQETSEINN